MKKILIFKSTTCKICSSVEEQIKLIDNENFNYCDVIASEENRNIFQKYGVLSVPTAILIKDDEEIDRFYGYKDHEFILNFFEGE